MQGLLNHLIGEREQPVGHVEAERARGLEIDDELEPGRLVDRQIGGLLALEHARGVDADLAEGGRNVRAIADQPAGLDIFALGVARRQP